MKHTVVIIGASGLVGRDLVQHILNIHSEHIHRLCALDISNSGIVNIDNPLLNFYSADIMDDDVIEACRLGRDEHITIVNLVAHDYPVTPQGMSSSYSDPFSISPKDFAMSIGLTAGSAYSIFHSLVRHKLLSVHVVLVGSIYAHILPDPILYSTDSSIYKPIAYSAGKAAQLPILKQAARYFAAHGGRCNCLSFGGIQAKQDSAFVHRYSDLSPQSSLISVADVMKTFCWTIFESPQSLNGANIMVDGGITCI